MPLSDDERQTWVHNAGWHIMIWKPGEEIRVRQGLDPISSYFSNMDLEIRITWIHGELVTHPPQVVNREALE